MYVDIDGVKTFSYYCWIPIRKLRTPNKTTDAYNEMNLKLYYI